jgi:two-component system cell cycle response regulator
VGAKILAVDDTLEAVELLRIMLETSGFEATTALTAQKALRLAAEEGFSAALLDLMMPDIDGLEICRRLRADPETANLAILIVTAANEPEVEDRAEAAGADGLIYKPVDLNDLVARLNEVLAARGLI